MLSFKTYEARDVKRGLQNFGSCCNLVVAHEPLNYESYTHVAQCAQDRRKPFLLGDAASCLAVKPARRASKKGVKTPYLRLLRNTLAAFRVGNRQSINKIRVKALKLRDFATSALRQKCWGLKLVWATVDGL